MTGIAPRHARALLVALLCGGSARAQQETEGLTDDADRAAPARAKAAYPRLPTTCAIANPMVERYAPSGCILEGDRLFVTFLAFKIATGDQVCSTEIVPGGKTNVAVLTPIPGEYFWPEAVRAAGDDLRVFFVRQHEGVAELMMIRRTGEQFGSPVPLVTLTGPLSRPALVSQQGKVWIAFENRTPPRVAGGRGGADVFLAPLEDEKLGEPVRAGDGVFGDLQPALAAAPDGSIWMAWTQWRGREFEVLARRFDPKTRQLGPVIDVSDDPIADDFHPALVVGADLKVWVAWDVLDDPRRGRSTRHLPGEEGRGREASLTIGCIEDGKVRDLVVPAGAQPPLAEGTLVSWSGGLPQLALDPAGRLLLVHRYFEPEDGAGPPQSYPLIARTLGADGWSDATFVAESEGESEEALLAAGATGAWIVGAADHRVEQVQNRLFRMPRNYTPLLEKRDWHLCGSFGPGRIQFTFAPFLSREHGAPPLLRDRAPRPATLRTDPLGASESDPILNGMQHATLPAVAAGGAVAADPKPLSIFYGDLHRHSNVSRCLEGLEARPLDRYVFAREAWHDDFFALTDHPGHADPLQAWNLCKLVDLARSPDFCVFQGFEWSSGRFGHENAIFRHRTDFLAAPVAPFDTPELLWAHLKEGEAITIPHHPAHAHLGMDWSHFDPRFARLVEIFQAARGSYEFENCFRVAESAGSDENFVRDALDQGLEFGLISSTDHGNGAAYAVALAEGLDRDAIFDALWDRRTFASTTKGLVVDFRRDGVLMGRSVKPGGAGRFTIDARGTRPLDEVVLFRDGAVVHALGRPPPAAPSAASATVQLRLRFWVAMDLRNMPYHIALTVPDGTVHVVPTKLFTGPAAARLTIDSDGPHAAAVASLGGEQRYRRVVNVAFVVDATPDARIDLDVEGHVLTTSLAALAREKLTGDADCGTWVLAPLAGTDDDPVDLATGLGVTELHDEWVDPHPPTEHAWYYARVIDAAGEVSWSSPIFVSPK